MKKQESAYGLGIISIFLIFAVLCLTVFATLAVSSARADLRLSEKNADYVQKYYAATAQCASFVRQARTAYSKTAPEAISFGIVEGDRIKYDVIFDIDENSRLHTVFTIVANDTGDSTDGICEYTTFEITTINTGETTSETSDALNVWQP